MDKIYHIKVLHLYFIFIPKVTRTETYFEDPLKYRLPIIEEQEKKKLKVVEIPYNEQKVEEFCLM